MMFGDIQKEIEACNVEKGWYDTDRTFGDSIALLHSEVSEMLEAYRKSEDIAAEAADVFIRLMDTCSRHDIDLWPAIRRKMDYNWTRPARHGGKLL